MKKSFTINIIKIYVLILYLTLINIELKAQLNDRYFLYSFRFSTKYIS